MPRTPRRRPREDGSVTVDDVEQKKSAKDISLPGWFQDCKRHEIIDYDTKRYPFRELYANWLGVSPVSALDKIHTLPQIQQATQPLHPQIVKGWKNAKDIKPKKLSGQARNYDTFTLQKLFQSPEYHQLINTYRLFIREIIAPLCTKEGSGVSGDYADAKSDSSSSHDDDVVYQCPPTTRVVLPTGKRTIAMHCDKDYKDHQPAEINFWIPLTRVWNTNTLWLESAPGKGDFQPQELDYGQLLKFDGYECRHYTIDNDSPGTTCRVSFDFRVVPSQLCVQRQRMGDFCVEETTETGYMAHPHQFWKITGQGRGGGEMVSTTANLLENEDNAEQRKPEHTTLSSLYESLSIKGKLNSP